MENKRKLSYVSLFSSAGVGCFGFKKEDFDCLATVEIIERRLRVQRANNKCSFQDGYICGDIRENWVKNKIVDLVKYWENKNKSDLDVLISTPPCQGISVANHKKKNEKGRNSLIIESIKLTKEINPKFFIYENVRGFLNTICTDIDGKDKKIREAIEINLAGNYHILYKVINFKSYGNCSSRTRTLVIGTRKDLAEITPFDIFPDYKEEVPLRKVIGHLCPLKEMGEIDPSDIYHNFRSYDIKMMDWIKDLKEGQSAFDNKDKKKIPHKVIDGRIIYNKNKNGDKYARCFWDKCAPCVHTRSDVLASQNTVHPRDNRVFSIRELMKMMTIPDNFNWTDVSISNLNSLSLQEKRKFLAKEEMNIRQSIGEGVPTVIFWQIAKKIKELLTNQNLSLTKIKEIIEKNNLSNPERLRIFIKENKLNVNYANLTKIAELANTQRSNNAAFYTPQDVCFSIIKDLPEAKNYKSIKILEPATGVGNFLPLLIKAYQDVPEVRIDVVDIDKQSIYILKALLKFLRLPKNIKINFIVDDFLLHNFDTEYDIVIGNPPFKKLVNEKELLAQYKHNVNNSDTNNVFSFFVEKSIKLGKIVALITPKSLLNAPEFNKTREIISSLTVRKIIDYGEKAFKGVKIETISFILDKKKKPADNYVEVESYILKSVFLAEQKYIMDSKFPYWLLYRNNFFDKVSKKLKLGIFNAFRDRQITKEITQNNSGTRVLKSRNIGSNEVINLKKYDTYINNYDKLVVSKFINKKNAVLVPNLTYNPRACFLPENCITDGSVAILTIKDNSNKVKKSDLLYYNTEEFNKFYAISRNYGTRSLNIDNNSVFFFGIKKEKNKSYAK